MTYPSVDTAQSGDAADAVRTLQAALSAEYSDMRSAEMQLTEAILTAHAVTVSGRSRLQDIQRQLIEAINNPVTALSTPAGERHYLMFLRSKIAEIQEIVDTGALTDEDHAKLTRALGSGYLLPTSGGAGSAARRTVRRCTDDRPSRRHAARARLGAGSVAAGCSGRRDGPGTRRGRVGRRRHPVGRVGVKPPRPR